jgi:hypothetical protein
VPFAIFGLGVCLVALIILTRVGPQHTTDQRFQRASTFFSDEAGTRAIYLVLRHFLPSTQQWRRPLSQLPAPTDPEAPTSMVIFHPHQPLSLAQADALDAWIARGGQAIVVSHRDWSLRSSTSHGQPDTSPSEDEEVDLPRGYLHRHGFKIVRRHPADEALETNSPLALDPYGIQWTSPAGLNETLATVGSDIVVGSKRIGEGRLVVVPDGAAFSNQRLRQSQNAVWLVVTCAAWGNGRVAIDEFHQGFGAKRGLVTLFGQFLATPWSWACLQVGLAGILYVFGTRRRFGRVYDPPVQRQARPIDLVDARGALFAAAQAKHLAVDLLHHYLQYRLSSRLGFLIHLDDPRLADHVTQKLPVLADHLNRYQSLVQKAQRGEPLSTHDVVTIGQLVTHISRESTSA